MIRKLERLLGCRKDVAALQVTYDDGVVTILGRDRNDATVLRLFFADVLLLRIADEGTRVRLQQTCLTEPGVLFVDDASSLIDWLKEESLGIRDVDQSRHYIVTLGEEIVDLVSVTEPVVTELPSVAAS